MKNLKVLFLVAVFSAAAFAQGYMKPAKEIQDILNAPVTPATSVSPAKDKIALWQYLRYPPIADVSEPMLRLAGLRINPRTNTRHLQAYFTALTFKNISDGKETKVNFAAGAKLTMPKWSADGKYIAVGNIVSDGVDLWIVDTSTAKANQLKGIRVNTAFGGFDWMPDQRSLLVDLIATNRSPAPPIVTVPVSPNIQETSGKTAAIRTYQDMLSSPNDEKLFDYYATSQLGVVSIDGKTKQIGKPAIYAQRTASPSGKYFLVERIKRPYSYLFPVYFFARDVDVLNQSGTVVYKVADVPLQDSLPEGGVPTGRRSYDWIPTEASTLMWVEALDGGDPQNKVTPRDRLMTYVIGTRILPKPLLETAERFSGSAFGERDGLFWFGDYDRNTQRRRIFVTDYRNPTNVKTVSDLNIRDRYNNIGSPVIETLPNGSDVILMDGNSIFLSGSGASPEGDRPFLRKMDLSTLKTEELFRSGADSYETFVELLDKTGNKFITRKESQTEPPNLFVNDGANKKRALTSFADPSPQLRGITKKLVKYKRPDGVELSFTLYLPPGYKEGTRLPTLVWAYPLEYTNKNVAGQVSGSTNRFTQIGGYSHLFLVLQGYAVLDEATVPIVGDPLTVNDTFIDQLVAGAKAAIDKGVEMGVVDRDRVAVGGHSYGAFMTANLLAHSRLFRAGIARSGAYNRTLTPFGFQSERRSFWEAPEIYFKLSPFMYADKIKDPLLMIHGEADNNSGTFPIQSERMFAAIQGNGGTARLVILPAESHGYSARESIEHVLWEQTEWMNKWVKNAKPRDEKKP